MPRSANQDTAVSLFRLTRVFFVCNVVPFMRAALTIQLLTRAFAGIVIVPRGRRMSWQAAKDYSIIGAQEEPV